MAIHEPQSFAGEIVNGQGRGRFRRWRDVPVSPAAHDFDASLPSHNSARYVFRFGSFRRQSGRQRNGKRRHCQDDGNGFRMGNTQHFPDQPSMLRRPVNQSVDMFYMVIQRYFLRKSPINQDRMIELTHVNHSKNLLVINHNIEHLSQFLLNEALSISYRSWKS